MLFKGWYDIPIVLAFSCGPAKTIQIRYKWTRIFLKMEKKTSVSTNIGEYEWTELWLIIEDVHVPNQIGAIIPNFSNGNLRFLEPLVIAGWQSTSMRLTPGDKKKRLDTQPG